MNLLSLLAEKGIVRKEDIPGFEEAARKAGEPIEAVLLKAGVDGATMLAAKGEYYRMPTRTLGENEKIPFETLEYIPEDSARHYSIVPLTVKDRALEVGIVDPDNLEALDALNFISVRENLPFKLFLISEADFGRVIEMYKGLSGEVTKALTELQTEFLQERETNSQKDSKKEESSNKILREDAPVTKIVANLLRYAVEGGASDVHIEPLMKDVRVRFRLDGILNTSLMLPTSVHKAVVARVKILCSMRLDEQRKPQDGRFSATIDGRKVDFRVSTFPTNYGEKVVMRILDTQKGVKTLEQIGMRPDHLRLIRDAIQEPYGIILVSGPTGSGKTTTLYSMLNEINRDELNVLSLEDPVEYNISGMSQSQVRPEIGYTFANGLRTTLRQDPDVIMVGEIRDKETAQLAIQAALTGHLVLSTIHTNNAIGVIPRLIDMGVDPYLIAPTLILATAQRLVRTLCPGTGTPLPVEASIKVMLEKQFSDLPEEFRKQIPMGNEFLEAEKTTECPTGLKGRAAVFEMMWIDREVESAVLKSAGQPELYQIMRKKGMLMMKEDAIIKAFEKKVPWSEVNTLGSELSGDPDSEETT